MPTPIIVPISPGITVAENYIIRFTAIDPTTGATVNGVTVSNAAILGDEYAPTEDAPQPVAQPGTAFSFGDTPA